LREEGVLKKLSLFVLFMLCLVVLVSIPTGRSGVQPPINTSTFYEGAIGWGPVDADAGVAYDTMSQELIFNSYQNLIAFNGEQYYGFVPQLAVNVPALANVTMVVTNTSTVAIGGDPTGTTWTDGVATYAVVWWTDKLSSGFGQGDVITLIPGYSTWTVDALSGTLTVTLGLWHGSYVFNIDTAHEIYFYDDNGNHVGKFSVDDAAYTLRRYLVLDMPAGPAWMYDKPLFGLVGHVGFDNSTAMVLAHMIDAAIVSDTMANTLTINTGCHFPDNAFKQILSSTWGCIGSQNNTMAIGGWNGDLFDTSKYGGPYPDWWIDWAGQGNGINYSLDPSDQLVPSAYVGTGPYHVATIDETNRKVVLQRNPDFWMGWPANYCGFVSSGYLDTVEIDYIADWNTRKADFLAGSIDTCSVPRSNTYEVLDNMTKLPIAPQIKAIQNLQPLALNMYMFDFNVNSTSTYVGTGSFPDGIPLDFFNNTHCRRAFAYSFNSSVLGAQAFPSGADYRNSFLIRGLYPDYYSSGVPSYFQSLSGAETELKAALFNGTSVWDSGFTLSLTYWGGISGPGIFVCYMMRDFFSALSTFDGRTGKPAFKINVQEISWSATLRGMTQRLSPMYLFGWFAEFADADDFTRPFMYSSGDYAFYQNYTAANGWGSLKDQLVDEAVATPDGPARQDLYTQLQMEFYDDCPSLTLNTPYNWFWCQYWVKGWYYDAMYPSAFYYTMWKWDNPWYNISGPTPGISCGVVGMKDIAYLIAHFGARPPAAGQRVDPKWVGCYGANGCVDPSGDRVCNMRDIAGAIQSFNAKTGTGHP
jgi:ABC-type transport system substrate-binding protein